MGALWILGSCVAATGMSVGVKDLAGGLDTFQITFVRCAAGLILILPMVFVRRLREAKERGEEGPLPIVSPRWRLHLLRGVLAAIAINCGYYSLAHLPLATATVLFFTAPLFVTLLAPLLLGERVGWRRWAATAVGFAGTVIVLRPSAQGVDPLLLVPIVSSLVFAIALIVGKKLSATEAPSTMLLYTTLVVAVATLPPAVLVWTAPSFSDWIFLGILTLFATARTYCDIRGYGTGEASFVANFQYLRIVFVSAAAYFIFAEIPDSGAILGACVIGFSSLYIAQREARLKRVPSRPAGTVPD